MPRQEVHIPKAVLFSVRFGYRRICGKLLLEVSILVCADFHFVCPFQKPSDCHVRRYAWDRAELSVDHDGRISRYSPSILGIKRVRRPLLSIGPALEIAELRFGMLLAFLDFIFHLLLLILDTFDYLRTELIWPRFLLTDCK